MPNLITGYEGESADEYYERKHQESKPGRAYDEAFYRERELETRGQVDKMLDVSDKKKATKREK